MRKFKLFKGYLSRLTRRNRPRVVNNLIDPTPRITQPIVTQPHIMNRIDCVNDTIRYHRRVCSDDGDISMVELRFTEETVNCEWHYFDSLINWRRNHRDSYIWCHCWAVGPDYNDYTLFGRGQQSIPHNVPIRILGVIRHATHL